MTQAPLMVDEEGCWKTNAEQDMYKDLVIKYQRDINCLSDPDRNMRKQSLVKLKRELVSQSIANSVCEHFYHSILQKPLLACFSDPVERCREISIGLVTELLHRFERIDPIVCPIAHVINQRLGVLPFKETAEEVRLLLLELLGFLLSKSSAAAVENASDNLSDIVAKAATDPFPDSKRACHSIIIVLAQKAPERSKMYTAIISRSVVGNLSHQHAKVRSTALQALEQLIPCGSDMLKTIMEECILPAVVKIVFDRTGSVRKQLVSVLTSWLLRINDKNVFEAHLFPLLLSLLSDDSPDVQQCAVESLNHLGAVWETERAADADGHGDGDGDAMDDSSTSIFGLEHMSFEPIAPFTARPHKGARGKARRLCGSILGPILSDMSNWTVSTRARASSTLGSLIILTEDAINPYLERIMASLAKICRDDEADVTRAVAGCVHALGRYADSQLLFAFLVPLATGKVAGHDTTPHRTHGLILLAMSIYGMQFDSIKPHLDRITLALCDPGLLSASAEAPELQEQISNVAASVIDVAKDEICKNDEYAFRLFWALSQMIASTPEDSFVHDKSAEYLDQLAQATAGGTLEALYTAHLPRLLDSMALPIDENGTCWTKTEPNRLLFDSLCRRAGPACAENISKIIPVFVAHASVGREADIRLVFLALLETMLGMDSTTTALKRFEPHANAIILKCIMPSIVWRSGRVASTVRKVAVACLYTLLRQGLASKSCLFETAPQILPVLKSCMDDDDAKTRQLVCLALQYLFVALPNALSAEPVNELYSEILKRLDDSNNLVRKACCATFIEFLGSIASRNLFKGTPIDYTLDCLFVHLDDAEKEIQEAVYQVILAAVPFDQGLVVKKATEHRARHRSPTYCDTLIEQFSP